MAYEALYRRYRPQTFEGIVGQEHITTILKNQVRAGRPAHAYLFIGSRGTGKTSTARILARAVNCLNPQDGEPCGVCEACLAMGEGNVDIVEMDAATNSSVDDARSLIEKARFMPMQLKKKVYIIDEVHGLSGAAFNALLKTLEEPPAHVLFILATTEPQKIPATIISRCQRMDFHRLNIAAMTGCIKGILKQAGVTIEDEGIAAIARTAEGGMRDALSLADQCISFCGEHVTTADVYNILGSMEADFLFETADALITGNAAEALKLLDKVVGDGRDLGVFLRDLTGHFRALLLTKLCGSCADLLDCTDDAMRRYLAQAARCSELRLLRAQETLLKAQSSARMLDMPRVLFEGALVRIARPEEAEKDFEALMVRVEMLEQKLAAVPESAAFVPREAKETPRHEAQKNEDDLPPWEAPAAQKPKERPAPQQAREAEEQVQKSAPKVQAPAAGSGAWTAETLWKALLEKLYEQDRMLQIIAMSGKAYRLTGGTLTVRFESEPKLKAVQKPQNTTLITSLLQSLVPDGVFVAVPWEKGGELKEQVMSLFGMNVEVVD
ncbi:MAG TPA: DNA polymerase III subunit gamma/tau [Clostridia bacterium]|nr:DNA polymerase III subunit gamma/tau [Clostridia bacterium]